MTYLNEDWCLHLVVQICLEELRLEELLGTGSTAEVYRAAWHGTDVAVKKLRSTGRDFHP